VNIFCIKGLHHGVFQGLESGTCKHNFYVPNWNSAEKPKPDNVIIMSSEMLTDPDPDFFGAILVQSPEDYQLVKNFDKPIIYYHLINSRGRGLDYIYANKNVIPVFLMNSNKISYSVYEGQHKTIYHGVDPDFWKGWSGEDKVLAAVKNNFNTRDPVRFALYKQICGDAKNTVYGTGQDENLGRVELRDRLRKSRVFMNVEIVGSPFDTAAVEAMMLGMPIISTDNESSGEFIRNGIEGFISNSVPYLIEKTRDLLNDHDMARELGENARKMAEIRFGKKQFNIQWNDFLNNLDYYRRK